MAKRVIATYLETAPQYMSQIEQAVLAQNSQELYQAAHTLKSSAAHIGAETLSDMCQQLENFGRNERIDEARILINQARNEFDQAIIALQKILGN